MLHRVVRLVACSLEERVHLVLVERLLEVLLHFGLLSRRSMLFEELVVVVLRTFRRLVARFL